MLKITNHCAEAGEEAVLQIRATFPRALHVEHEHVWEACWERIFIDYTGSLFFPDVRWFFPDSETSPVLVQKSS